MLCRALLLACLFGSACTHEIGTPARPLRLSIVPPGPDGDVRGAAELLERALAAATPLHVDVSVPRGYREVVDGLGDGHVDIALPNTATYLVANERHHAHARLAVVRDGAATYDGAIFVAADSEIHTLKELAGRRVGIVDVTSMTGHLLPARQLLAAHITPGAVVRLGSHEAVVRAVYAGEVDAGFAYADARDPVSDLLDITTRVRVLQRTGTVPNEPVVFRDGLSDELSARLTQAILDAVHTPDGRRALSHLNGGTDLVPTTDAAYDEVRAAYGDAVGEVFREAVSRDVSPAQRATAPNGAP